MFAPHAKSYWNHVANRNGSWERRRPRLLPQISDTNTAGEDACAPSIGNTPMEIVQKIIEVENVQLDRAREDAYAPSSSGHLLKILGVGFGVAVGLGGTIRVRIL